MVKRTHVRKVANMADTLIFGGKKITELRVVDLRQELEKRGFEKSGVKAVLIERLQKVRLREFSVFLCRVLKRHETVVGTRQPELEFLSFEFHRCFVII